MRSNAMPTPCFYCVEPVVISVLCSVATHGDACTVLFMAHHQFSVGYDSRSGLFGVDIEAERCATAATICMHIIYIYDVIICYSVRALTCNGWCGPNIICWSVPRSETIIAFDARIVITLYIAIISVAFVISWACSVYYHNHCIKCMRRHLYYAIRYVFILYCGLVTWVGSLGEKITKSRDSSRRMQS